MKYILNQSGIEYTHALLKKASTYILLSVIVIASIITILIFFSSLLIYTSELICVFVLSFCVFFGIWLPFVINGKLAYNITSCLNIHKDHIHIVTSNWFFLRKKNYVLLKSDCIIDTFYIKKNIKTYRIKSINNNVLAYIVPEFMIGGDKAELTFFLDNKQ